MGRRLNTDSYIDVGVVLDNHGERSEHYIYA